MKLSRLTRLIFESEAADQARQLGLTHVAYGMYADDSGEVVARTVNGRLVKVGKNKPGVAATGVALDSTPDVAPINAYDDDLVKAFKGITDMPWHTDVTPAGRPRKPHVPMPALDPSELIAKGKWTPEIMQDALNLMSELGKKWSERYADPSFYVDSGEHLRYELQAAIEQSNTREEFVAAFMAGMDVDLARPVIFNSQAINEVNKLNTKGEVLAWFSPPLRVVEMGDRASEYIAQFKYLTTENIEKYLSSNRKQVAEEDEETKQKVYQAGLALYGLIHEFCHAKSPRELRHWNSTDPFNVGVDEGITEIKARRLFQAMTVGTGNRLAEGFASFAFRAYPYEVAAVKILEEIDPKVGQKLWATPNSRKRREIITQLVTKLIDVGLQSFGQPPDVQNTLRGILHNACTSSKGLDFTILFIQNKLPLLKALFNPANAAHASAILTRILSRKDGK